MSLVEKTSACDDPHLNIGNCYYWLIVLRSFNNMLVAENKQYLIHMK